MKSNNSNLNIKLPDDIAIRLAEIAKAIGESVEDVASFFLDRFNKLQAG